MGLSSKQANSLIVSKLLGRIVCCSREMKSESCVVLSLSSKQTNSLVVSMQLGRVSTRVRTKENESSKLRHQFFFNRTRNSYSLVSPTYSSSCRRHHQTRRALHAIDWRRRARLLFVLACSCLFFFFVISYCVLFVFVYV